MNLLTLDEINRQIQVQENLTTKHTKITIYVPAKMIINNI